MPNYKQLGRATGQLGKIAGYAMQYADKISPGIFRTDAPIHRFVPKQSLQTKIRKLQYHWGKLGRKITGQPEPPVRKPSQYNK